MIEKNVSFISSAARGSDVDVASHEPSHIHIARPSRVQRQGHTASSVAPTDQQVRELVAAEDTVQAA